MENCWLQYNKNKNKTFIAPGAKYLGKKRLLMPINPEIMIF
jgi:hypothetical protein